MTPEQKRQYLRGALTARDFLRCMQADLKLHRRFEPKTLRWELHIQTEGKPVEHRAGFLDALGAYVLTTLEGVLVNLYRWEILRVLERADKQK